MIECFGGAEDSESHHSVFGSPKWADWPLLRGHVITSESR